MSRLFDPDTPLGERKINARIVIREKDDQVQVVKDGELYAVFSHSDREFRKAVIIQLARIGAASFRELCAGFEIDRETLERYLIGSQQGGFRAVVDEKPGPKGPWKPDSITRLEIIKEFVNDPSLSDREIARRVSARRPILVDHGIVRRVLRHAGLKPGGPSSEEAEADQQLTLPFGAGIAFGGHMADGLRCKQREPEEVEDGRQRADERG